MTTGAIYAGIANLQLAMSGVEPEKVLQQIDSGELKGGKKTLEILRTLQHRRISARDEHNQAAQKRANDIACFQGLDAEVRDEIRKAAEAAKAKGGTAGQRAKKAARDVATMHGINTTSIDQLMDIVAGKKLGSFCG